MKKIFFVTAVLAVCLTGFSQSISKITIIGNGDLDVISFGLGENVQVYVTKGGGISKWGYDKFIGIQENYGDILEPYIGRVEYYSQEEDEALRGRVKYIGKTLLTYYTAFENEELRGKLKSIGAVNMDYYLSYDDKALAGSLKTIGRNYITWYASYENEILRGKLKSVGPTTITYYGGFEDKAYRGKIKSIDRYILTYFSSVEQYSGSIKSGAPVLNANGIKFFVRNY